MRISPLDFSTLKGGDPVMGTMVSPTDLRRGVRVKLDFDLYTVIEFQHVTPGNWRGFVRTKMKSLTTGRILERTFRSNEEVELADVSMRPMQFLYHEGDMATFMDSETYEQVGITHDLLGDAIGYLKDNSEVQVTFYEGRAIGVELPPKVDLAVAETYAASRGDSVNNVTKEATLETGMKVQVPLFINVGDVIRISSKDGSYQERVSTG